MTSSVHELSDNSGEDEQQRHPEPQLQSLSHETGMSHPTVLPNVQYATPVVGCRNTVAPVAYPYPDPYYRSIFAPYDAQPYPVQPYPAQPLMGIQQAGVPLSSDEVEEPVFVNAKQYHGIMRCRQSRAKAESENKVVKSRKPYLHESRHLHALRRTRGLGGRFLNSKKGDKQKEAESGNKSHASINLNSEKDENASLENTSRVNAISM